MKIKYLKQTLGFVVATSVLSGCCKTGTCPTMTETKVENKLPSVVCTNFASYDFAKHVVGDKGTVTMLIKPGAESHSFEPTPQDIQSIHEADVFIYAGGDSDHWIEGILESVDHDGLKQINMMDCVETMEEEIKEGMSHEHHHHDHEEHADHEHEHEEDCCMDEHDHEEHGEHCDHEEECDHEEDCCGHEEHADHDHEEHEHEHELDEHVWTSVRNAILIVNKIDEVMDDVNPSDQAVYDENTSAYVKQLEDLDNTFKDVINNSKRKEIVVGDRFPFLYFVKDYGLDYHAAFPGCSSDTQPDAKTVAFLVDHVKEHDIPVVFHIELSNEEMCDSICDATGAKKELLNAIHNVSDEDFKNGVTYIDLMNHNVEVLKEALN